MDTVEIEEKKKKKKKKPVLIIILAKSMRVDTKIGLGEVKYAILFPKKSETQSLQA